MERLDRRIYTLTEKVKELENCLPNEEDMGGNNINEDAVFDEDGNIDAAATRAKRLRRRLLPIPNITWKQQQKQGEYTNTQQDLTVG
jgi:hypothetical protein